MENLGKSILKVIPGGTLPENTESSSNDKNICSECGKEIKPVFIPVVEKWLLPACECETEKHLEQERARKQEKRMAKIDRLFKNSGLGPRFTNCSFENWEERNGTEKAFEAAKKFRSKLTENIVSGQGLLIFGNPGNGKSHLAAAIINHAIREHYTAILERVPKLLAKIRSTFNGGEVSEQQIMGALIDADLLVLDDAGAEKLTQWTEPTLYTIIDERYTNKKSLIVTTNSRLDELEKKVGFRAMDRLLEMCEIVENQGNSYRQELARMKAGRK